MFLTSFFPLLEQSRENTDAGMQKKSLFHTSQGRFLHGRSSEESMSFTVVVILAIVMLFSSHLDHGAGSPAQVTGHRITPLLRRRSAAVWPDLRSRMCRM